MANKEDSKPAEDAVAKPAEEAAAKPAEAKAADQTPVDKNSNNRGGDDRGNGNNRGGGLGQGGGNRGGFGGRQREAAPTDSEGNELTEKVVFINRCSKVVKLSLIHI